MKAYRIRIRPLSTWASPWLASTLFGSICWKYRLLAGEASLLEWLKGFQDGTPPFVLSDPVPGDYLPLPVGVMPSGTGKLKAPLLISGETFRSLARHPAPTADAIALGAWVVPADRLQASIGRDSGTAEVEAGGALFEVKQEVFAEGAPGYFSLYFRADEQIVPVLQECLLLLSYQGYGQDSSTGVGAFAVESEVELCAWLDEVAGANGFVALSHFVPKSSDPTDGFWRLHTSYPKFHGSAVSHPFKGSLITLAAGSQLRTGGTPAPWYGRMIPVPRPGLERALHYGLCMAAPLVIPDA